MNNRNVGPVVFEIFHNDKLVLIPPVLLISFPGNQMQRYITV